MTTKQKVGVGMARGKGLLFPMIWCGVCLVLALALWLLGGRGVLPLLGGPQPFQDVETQDLNGAYVSLDVVSVLDEYAYTEDSNGRVMSREYAVATPDGLYYIGLLVDKSDLDELTEPLESLAFDAYPTHAVVSVEGMVAQMDAETTELFDAALGYYGVQQSMGLPFVLHVGRVGNLSPFMIWLTFICACLLVVVAVAMAALALTRVRE